MTTPMPLVLDSDVFIAAKNAYYAFDLCPGFWQALLEAQRRGRIRSIDRVRSELLLGREEEDLVHWVKKVVPGAFFHDSNSQEVSAAYGEVMLWVQRHPQYFDRVKAKFATEADGWLVAYSMVNGTVVVTNEQPRPGARTASSYPTCAQSSRCPTRTPSRCSGRCAFGSSWRVRDDD